MRKILFAVIMAAGVGLIGTSAMAAPAAPISNGLTNVLEAQYYGHRYHRRHHRRHCRTVRVCDVYGYCRWRTRCY